MLINKTETFCCKCQKKHIADIVSENNQIYLKLNCCEELIKIKISNNAGIFLSLREKSHCNFTDESSGVDYSWENFIEITTKCNFECPVCYVYTDNNEKRHLSYNDIFNKIKKIKKEKNRIYITLSGGEPTLHPDLFKIIKNAKKIGVTSKMLTNGFILGKDKDYAVKLKKNKIEYCFIQFDTLNPELHKIIRNNDTLEIKKQALQNAKNAGIQIGTITMFIKKSLPDIGKLITYLAGFSPNLSIMSFLCPSKSAGRFNLNDNELIFREDIIKAIIDSKFVNNINLNHFWPFPKFLPLNIDIHPDCAALLYLAVIDGKIELLDDYINFEKLYKILAKIKIKNKINLAIILFLISLLRSVKRGKLIKCLKMFYGYITMKGKNSLIVICIQNFMNSAYQDLQRIKHCTSCNVTNDGEIIPICIYNHNDPLRLNLTRINLNNKN